jgi:hypothetical protein
MPVIKIRNINHLYTLQYIRITRLNKMLFRGQILARNQDKSLESFPPCYSPPPLQLCLELSISSKSHNLLQFLQFQLLYTVKEKGVKPNGKPSPSLWFKKSVQKPQAWEHAQKSQKNCTSMNLASGYDVQHIKVLIKGEIIYTVY